MTGLPWWAKLLIPAVVKLLMVLLKPFLDKTVSPDVEAAIFAFLNHLVGADNQALAIQQVLDAHACAGIGCAPTTKPL